MKHVDKFLQSWRKPWLVLVQKLRTEWLLGSCLVNLYPRGYLNWLKGHSNYQLNRRGFFTKVGQSHCFHLEVMELCCLSSITNSDEERLTGIILDLSINMIIYMNKTKSYRDVSRNSMIGLNFLGGRGFENAIEL